MKNYIAKDLIPLRIAGLIVVVPLLFCYFSFVYGTVFTKGGYSNYVRFIFAKCSFDSLSEFEAFFSNLYSNQLFHQSGKVFPSIVFGAISIGLGCFFCIYKRNKKKGPNNNKVTRGPRLLNSEEMNNALKSLVDKEVDEIHADLPIEERMVFSREKLKSKLIGHEFECSSNDAKVALPEYIFSRHLLLNGATGVGKSTLIKHLITYFNKCGHKSIILDINGEIYSELGRKEDIILSPFDSRSHRWDFDKETSLKRSINSKEFAKYIVAKGSDQNKFWWGGGRTVLSEIIQKFNDSSKIWKAVTDPKREFIKDLSGIVHNIIGKVGSSQDAGIFGTLSTDLSFLKDLIKLNEASDNDYFSIAEWAQSDCCKNVYIIFSDKDFESFSILIKIWLNLAILGRFDAGKDNDLPKLNIIADEMGDLGHLEKLPSALARLRKYGGSVTLGIQSEGQLEAIYGKDYTKVMKGNIGSRFIFRASDNNEAKGLSDLLGRSEVVNVSESTSSNKGSSGGGVSTTESTSYKNIVLDSEIKSLPDGHYYLKCLNLSPSKLRIRKKKWETIHALHQESIFVENRNSGEIIPTDYYKAGDIPKAGTDWLS